MARTIPDALIASLKQQLGSDVDPRQLKITAGPTWSPFHEAAKTIVEVNLGKETHYVIYSRTSLASLNDNNILVDVTIDRDQKDDVDETVICQVLSSLWDVTLEPRDFFLIPQTLFGETVTLATKESSLHWYGYLKVTLKYN